MKSNNNSVRVYLGIVTLVLFSIFINPLQARAHIDGDEASEASLASTESNSPYVELQAYIAPTVAGEEKIMLDIGRGVIPGTVVTYDILLHRNSAKVKPTYEFNCPDNTKQYSGELSKNEGGDYYALSLECLTEKEGDLVATVKVSVDGSVIDSSNTLMVGTPEHVSQNKAILLASVHQFSRVELFFFLFAGILTIYALLIYVNRPRA